MVISKKCACGKNVMPPDEKEYDKCYKCYDLERKEDKNG